MTEEGAALRVFVVEDEPLLVLGLEQALHDLDLETAIVASSVEDGLYKARRGGFDLALLDVDLAGENSYPIADELVRQKIPFLFVTAYAFRLEGRYLEHPTLEKPWDQVGLWASIQETLNKPAAKA